MLPYLHIALCVGAALLTAGFVFYYGNQQSQQQSYNFSTPPPQIPISYREPSNEGSRPRRRCSNANQNRTNDSRSSTPLGQNKDQCSICLTSLRSNVKKLICEHSFHAHCINSWFHLHTTCPNCRRNVKT